MLAAVVCRLSGEPAAPPMPAPALSTTLLPMMRVESSRSSTMVLPALLKSILTLPAPASMLPATNWLLAPLPVILIAPLDEIALAICRLPAAAMSMMLPDR